MESVAECVLTFGSGLPLRLSAVQEIHRPPSPRGPRRDMLRTVLDSCRLQDVFVLMRASRGRGGRHDACVSTW